MLKEFFSENRAVYEIMLENVQPERPQITIRRMRFACWTTKYTHTHSVRIYIIVIAFPRQQWFRERGSMLLLVLSMCARTDSGGISHSSH